MFEGVKTRKSKGSSPVVVPKEKKDPDPSNFVFKKPQVIKRRVKVIEKKSSASSQEKINPLKIVSAKTEKNAGENEKENQNQVLTKIENLVKNANPLKRKNDNVFQEALQLTTINKLCQNLDAQKKKRVECMEVPTAKFVKRAIQKLEEISSLQNENEERVKKMNHSILKGQEKISDEVKKLKQEMNDFIEKYTQDTKKFDSQDRALAKMQMEKAKEDLAMQRMFTNLKN